MAVKKTAKAQEALVGEGRDFERIPGWQHGPLEQRQACRRKGPGKAYYGQMIAAKKRRNHPEEASEQKKGKAFLLAAVLFSLREKHRASSQVGK